MFDKNKFAQILKNINDTYDSQRDFAKKSEINRTYLSQYMNMQLDKPPKPYMLKKLSNASNGVTTYNELMQVCGYVFVTELTSTSYGINLEYWTLIFGNVKKVSLSQNGSIFFASFLDKMLQESKKSNNGYFEINFDTSEHIPLTDNIEEYEEYNKIFCFIICLLISNNTINITEIKKENMLNQMREHLEKLAIAVKEEKQNELLRDTGAMLLEELYKDTVPLLRYSQSRIRLSCQ